MMLTLWNYIQRKIKLFENNYWQPIILPICCLLKLRPIPSADMLRWHHILSMFLWQYSMPNTVFSSLWNSRFSDSTQCQTLCFLLSEIHVSLTVLNAKHCVFFSLKFTFLWQYSMPNTVFSSLWNSRFSDSTQCQTLCFLLSEIHVSLTVLNAKHCVFFSLKFTILWQYSMPNTVFSSLWNSRFSDSTQCQTFCFLLSEIQVKITITEIL